MASRIQREKADALFAKILEYLELNESVGSIEQEPYKSDMFSIFRQAYMGRFCGTRYRVTNENKLKRVTPSKPQITDDAIWGYAKDKGWVSAEMDERDEKYRKICIVRTWWREWTYAWDQNPPRSTRSRKVR